MRQKEGFVGEGVRHWFAAARKCERSAAAKAPVSAAFTLEKGEANRWVVKVE